MRETLPDKIFILLNYGFATLWLIAVAYPLIFIISASMSDPELVSLGEMWLWPKGITFAGYDSVFKNAEIWIGYRNTIFYTVAGVCINLLVTLPCAYALARKSLVGRNAVTFFLIFTMFFNGGLIPTYLLVKNLGMINTIWALLLPAAASVFLIVIARTFFQSTIPRELEESAELDGCSDLRLFRSIVLPISKPIVAVMALFYGVGHWNSYFDAMIYLSNRDIFPLQLFLREILIINEMSSTMMAALLSNEVELMADQAKLTELVRYVSIIIAALPLLIVYPFLQRYFVKGVLVGSLKG